MKTIFTKNLKDAEISFELEGDWNTIQSELGQIMNYIKQHDTKLDELNQTKPSTSSKHHHINNTKKSSPNQSQMLPNLLDADDIAKIRKYYEQKSPSSHIENYIVIAVWLRDNKEIDTISADEIWTSYKILKIKPPKNIIQVFRDGKSKKGFFEFDDKSGKYYITNLGESYVTYDLPRKETK